ncbi:GNAT family protein [Brevibacillus parabrevis]|uniref:GNAT family N-acetyltransferase n=1 Tax=Brevibacillus parabrevis TaxID=54914 RepID=UPI0028D22BEE|nr:GNAT family protein [Brevibacillus parabrevis]
MTVANGFWIRPYEQDDFPAIAAYCLPEEQAIYTSLPVDVVAVSQANAEQRAFVVYDSGTLVGCFALSVPKGGKPYYAHERSVLFQSFSIDSRQQKQGYAFRTLRELPNMARQYYPEADEVILTVHHTNIPAITLYQKAGFVDRGERFAGEHGEEWIFHLALHKDRQGRKAADRGYTSEIG